MSDMTLREYEGKQIRQRDNGQFSLTDMAHATGKRVALYLENAATEAFLQELSSDVGIPTSELISSNKGGCPANQGTWAHAQVAMHFAYWASPKLQVHVSRWMLEKLERAVDRQAGLAHVDERRLAEIVRESVKAYAAAGQLDVSSSKLLPIRERIHQRCDRPSETDCRRIMGRIVHWARHYNRQIVPQGMQDSAPWCIRQEDIWLVDKAIDEVWERHGINGLPLFRKPQTPNG